MIPIIRWIKNVFFLSIPHQTQLRGREVGLPVLWVGQHETPKWGIGEKPKKTCGWEATEKPQWTFQIGRSNFWGGSETHPAKDSQHTFMGVSINVGTLKRMVYFM